MVHLTSFADLAGLTGCYSVLMSLFADAEGTGMAMSRVVTLGRAEAARPWNAHVPIWEAGGR